MQAELPEAWTEVYHKAVSRLPFACGDLTGIARFHTRASKVCSPPEH